MVGLLLRAAASAAYLGPHGELEHLFMGQSIRRRAYQPMR